MTLDAIVLISGGLDSCVTAAIARTETSRLGALHVGYGQRTAERELRAFEEITEHLGIAERLVTSIGFLAEIGGSSLTDTTIPVSEANLRAQSPPSSYVPFRNTHLLSIAVSWAEVCGACRVFIGAVEEDSSGYPDCRRAYFDEFERLVALGSRLEGFTVATPLIAMRKSDIVREGMRLGAPLHLTWSCYSESEVACGVCDSCALRLRGFQEAGVADPLPYRVRPDYVRWS
ncbi:MAG: 7-cyano-7-deazaguanine synthase QueC [Fimbriimonadia bacterium]|jgi:7-cyano-7-deazaguanine synthase